MARSPRRMYWQEDDDQGSALSKAVSNLSQLGHIPVEQLGPESFTVGLRNRSGEYRAVVQDHEGIITVGTNLGRVVEPTADFYRGTLELNHELNFGKVGLDGEHVTISREIRSRPATTDSIVGELALFNRVHEVAVESLSRLAQRTGTGLDLELDKLDTRSIRRIHRESLE